MRLTVEVKQALGNFQLDAAFTAEGGVTALFGQSGSGKTSLVRAISGLAKPQSGKVLFDEEILLDTEKDRFVPPHRRRFGYVFQEARLFPHLSVRRNLGFGQWFASAGKDAIAFERVVDLLGIASLLDRPPTHLSGGERQRVSIGRALLSSPRLLLMDEPLAALDDDRKAEILPYLGRLRDEAGIPIVYVSHSVTEVGQLADRVVMMREGRVAVIGSPSEVLKGHLLSVHERRDAGAVLSGVVRSVEAGHGLGVVAAESVEITVSDPALHEGQSVRLHIPERDVMIATEMPAGVSALNILPGTICGFEDDPDGSVRVAIAIGEVRIFARITAFSRDRLGLSTGRRVYAVVKSVALAR